MNVIVPGASDNPNRYSFKAMHKLIEYDHRVFCVWFRKAQLVGLEITNSKSIISNVRIISIYINDKNQKNGITIFSPLIPNLSFLIPELKM